MSRIEHQCVKVNVYKVPVRSDTNSIQPRNNYARRLFTFPSLSMHADTHLGPIQVRELGRRRENENAQVSKR